MTTKGEAIALGIAQMSTVELSSCDHGVVAKVKRCIMERDLYPRRWGLGPVALEKKKMKSDGKLDVSSRIFLPPLDSKVSSNSSQAKHHIKQKYGRANELTPAKWQSTYKDFNAPLENGTTEPNTGTNVAPLAEMTSTEDVADAPPIPPVTEDSTPTTATATATATVTDVNVAMVGEEAEAASKKRKRHEEETPEQRAERKRKKKEKKEKRKAKGEKEAVADGGDSE